MLGSKDAAVAFAIRRALNTRLDAFGEITDLSLDAANRRARFRLALHGEREPIDVEVRGYCVERADEGDWLSVDDAVASRQWLTAALHQFVVGRRFHISRKAALVLRLFA
jgi:hypothetical protein